MSFKSGCFPGISWQVAMADQNTSESPSTSNVSGGSSESSQSTVNINIKTLDSRTYAFDVDKNVSLLYYSYV